MQEDRFFTALGSLIDRVLNDRTRPDFRAFYYAKIISWQAGGGPSGSVDVQFEDTFATGQPGSFKLGSANGVAILPSIGGLSYKPQPGTRVLVGWQGGDERYPYVAGWVSNGGALEATMEVSTTLNLGDTSGATLAKSAAIQALSAFAIACQASATDPTLVTAAAALNTALTGSNAGVVLLPAMQTTKTKAS